MRSELIHKIFDPALKKPDELILEVFHYQYEHNRWYREFCQAIHRLPTEVKTLQDLPFLPIRFFKSHPIKSGDYTPETFFESSGTTGTINSKHYLRSLDVYRKSFMEGFRKFYGEPGEWCILALLPAYLERENSSLVVMAADLIQATGNANSGFYLYDYQRLHNTLKDLENKGQKTLLIGVTFALLDFAATFPIELKTTTIMETGGMKGRRKELTRKELHETLAAAFGNPSIHSEYGMTELLSQAYAGDNGHFFTPPWMKILLREEDDPLSLISTHRHPPPADGKVASGAINVIDLANIDSCSFIATDDMATMYVDGGFEVLGRIDNSDIRGCSLMAI